MTPDIILHVRFLTEKEGGRSSAIETDRYGCPIMINSHGFDCRFMLDHKVRFELGKTYEIPIKFLNPDLAFKELEEGMEISLWEGKTIAIGKIRMI